MNSGQVLLLAVHRREMPPVMRSMSGKERRAGGPAPGDLGAGRGGAEHRRREPEHDRADEDKLTGSLHVASKGPRGTGPTVPAAALSAQIRLFAPYRH